ncbi:hypothetical protein EC529_05955, partial [Helicobacter pylori]
MLFNSIIKPNFQQAQFIAGSPMQFQKALLHSSFFLPLFLSCCIAEENGAYASVGFEYSISHAVEHNNPFL